MSVRPIEITIKPSWYSPCSFKYSMSFLAQFNFIKLLEKIATNYLHNINARQADTSQLI